jgi:hypothetical protein
MPASSGCGACIEVFIGACNEVKREMGGHLVYRAICFFSNSVFLCAVDFMRPKIHRGNTTEEGEAILLKWENLIGITQLLLTPNDEK